MPSRTKIEGLQSSFLPEITISGWKVYYQFWLERQYSLIESRSLAHCFLVFVFFLKRKNMPWSALTMKSLLCYAHDLALWLKFERVHCTGVLSISSVFWLGGAESSPAFPLAIYMHHYKCIPSLWSHQSLGLTILLKGQRCFHIQQRFLKSIHGTYLAKCLVLSLALYLKSIRHSLPIIYLICHHPPLLAHSNTQESFHFLCHRCSMIKIPKVVV